jgi:predicted 3-demethylubiquinone-9 3-methyltransferase (glyoxalase superfamily)
MTVLKFATRPWFENQTEQAARFYASLFEDSRVDKVTLAPAGVPGAVEGSPFIVELTLMGQNYIFLNGGPQFPLNAQVSLYVRCDDRVEVDHHWDAFLADGGTPQQCGWLTDRPPPPLTLWGPQCRRAFASVPGARRPAGVAVAALHDRDVQPGGAGRRTRPPLGKDQSTGRARPHAAGKLDASALGPGRESAAVAQPCGDSGCPPRPQCRRGNAPAPRQWFTRVPRRLHAYSVSSDRSSGTLEPGASSSASSAIWSGTLRFQRVAGQPTCSAAPWAPSS